MGGRPNEVEPRRSASLLAISPCLLSLPARLGSYPGFPSFYQPRPFCIEDEPTDRMGGGFPQAPRNTTLDQTTRYHPGLTGKRRRAEEETRSDPSLHEKYDQRICGSHERGPIGAFCGTAIAVAVARSCSCKATSWAIEERKRMCVRVAEIAMLPLAPLQSSTSENEGGRGSKNGTASERAMQ